jgi:hypothetical protein
MSTGTFNAWAKFGVPLAAATRLITSSTCCPRADGFAWTPEILIPSDGERNNMMEWDPGPPPNIRSIFEAAPLAAYEGKPNRFRLEWGPHYYRGRLDATAKALIIRQDPAADENVARRILVGEAGQRVQGLLVKLGLTRVVGQFEILS